MPEQMDLHDGQNSGGEITCIHTRKIFDSCQAKDCLEDLRFYPTRTGQAAVNSAAAVRSGRAELLDVSLTVAPVGLGRGFYEVCAQFYYRAVMELSTGGSRPMAVEGLLWFSKRCVLYGSEGRSKLFTSAGCAAEGQVPTAVCEAVDPLVLSTRLTEGRSGEEPEGITGELPELVRSAFDEELELSGECNRRIYVTLGQFSILRLEREAQLLMPVYDYCMPDKECACSEPHDEDPCQLFQSVDFPVDDFFPRNGKQ
jgi:hypothetical protein